MLRIFLFLFMAAGMAVFLFVAYASLHPPAQPVAVMAAKVVVLAAANTLRAGSLMKPDDIEAREMPEDRGARRCAPRLLPQARSPSSSAQWFARRCCSIR